MSDNNGLIRGYSQVSRAWYGKQFMPERGFTEKFYVGLYDADGGGTGGEFNITFDVIGARLQVYDDAWGALHEFKDLLEVMKNLSGEKITPDRLKIYLDDLDIKDLTKIEMDAKNEKA